MTTTESQVEQDLIAKLEALKYSYRPDIRDRSSLEANFREKFQELNRVKLSDSEFERLKDELVTADVFAASRRLREINSFERDDGSPLFYTLVNIKDWCKNSFEVVNQLRINTDNSHHRYDVVLLINGVPVVQIELKTLAISPRRAMQQVVEYKNDPGNGYTKTLMCFMQLFIVSNRTDTWYFANNNTRHFSFDADERFLPLYQFADESNDKITHIDPFAEKFLAKCTLGEMISRYMVLVANEQKLMIMRPYQIYAVRAIVDCIHQNRGNGYVWHTTGSGKTLTSFKTSTLLKDHPDIEKCLFVVDRKDLDRQTREEFNKFQAGCVEENTNTETLVRRLLSTDYADKVIVTTIQKLGIALDGTHKRKYKERLEPLRNKRVVFIFDECHRSQFGDNHKSIKDFFPNAQLFGFTGTPIFGDNANDFRFKGYGGLAPKSAADFAFLLHGFHFLAPEGTMAIILPHGVLFRSGAEERIRAKLLNDGNIDTVIGLPANLFFSTSIPVCVLVLKRCKKSDDVLFINAAEHFEKGKRQNRLLPGHIKKIVDTYKHRAEEDRYSMRVPMERIKKEGFNLNISRYISTAQEEEKVNLKVVHQQLVDIEKEIAKSKDKHNAFLAELGLPLLP